MEVQVYGRLSSSPSYGGWPSTDERSFNDSIDRWHSEPGSSTLAASSSPSSVVTSTCYSSDAESHEWHDRSPCPNVEEIPSFSYLSPDFRSLFRNKTRKPTRASNNPPDGLTGALNSYLEGLLPPNYEDVVSRSVSPVECWSVEELYFRLSKPVLVDDGELSIAIDMLTGRRSLMLSASKLGMAPNDHSWKWISREAEESYWKMTLVPDSRFPEVAELLGGVNLEINAEVNTSELSPQTCVYAAFFVFALSYPFGFHGRFQEASITVGGLTTRHTVCLSPAKERRFFLEQTLVKMPQSRSDGWKEVEMGQFFSRDVGDGDGDDDRLLVRMSLNGLEKNLKGGLIIQGIEVRPKRLGPRREKF